MPEIYFEIRIRPLKKQNTEELVAMLDQYGFNGFWEQEDMLIAYATKATFNQQLRNELIALCREWNCRAEWQETPGHNWNETWEKNFSPVVIGGQCRIRAPFHPPGQEMKYDIIIEPRMAFGTGHHETTSMMISLILGLPVRGKTILDVGTGTGILAVLAGKMGAAEILAIDNDEWAVENAGENIKKNEIQGIRVVHGDVLSIKNKTFEIIFANINRNTLLDNLPYYAESLKFKGDLLISGFYGEDFHLINEKAQMVGMVLTDQARMNNWLALHYKKEG